MKAGRATILPKVWQLFGGGNRRINDGSVENIALPTGIQGSRLKKWQKQQDRRYQVTQVPPNLDIF